MDDNGDIQQIIQEGEMAKRTAIEYADWLVTTVNESMPDQSSPLCFKHNKHK